MVSRSDILMLGISAGVIGSITGGLLLYSGMALIVSGGQYRLAAAAAGRAGRRRCRLDHGPQAGRPTALGSDRTQPPCVGGLSASAISADGAIRATDSARWRRHPAPSAGFGLPRHGERRPDQLKLTQSGPQGIKARMRLGAARLLTPVARGRCSPSSRATPAPAGSNRIHWLPSYR